MTEESLLNETVRELKQVMKLYRGRIDAITRKNGLFWGQPPILYEISEREGCTQVELAESLGVSAPSIAASTKRLEKSGLIRKETDDSNLRRNKIYLTDCGREALRSTKTDIDSLNRAIFERITAEDRVALSRLCAVMNSVLMDAADEAALDSERKEA